MKILTKDDLTLEDNLLTINKNGIIKLRDFSIKDGFKLIINNSEVKIIDEYNLNKKIVLNNSNCDYFYILEESLEKELNFTVNKGELEVNMIDVLNEETKLNVTVDLAKENSSVVLNTGIIAQDKQKKVYNFKANGLKPFTFSEVNNFGIAKDESLISFEVNSLIENGSKKSEAHQLNKIILLDESASGINIPILTIYENDVKASHGATIGMIDPEALFYLRSRGLSLSEARNLICLGHIQYLIKQIEDKSIETKLTKHLSQGVAL